MTAYAETTLKPLQSNARLPLGGRSLKMLVFITALLGTGPTVAYTYYSLVGWPATRYITHLGPLWYSPWGNLLLLGNLVLLFLLPLATLLLGVVISIRANRISHFLQLLILAGLQAIWGLIDLLFLFRLVD